MAIFCFLSAIHPFLARIIMGQSNATFLTEEDIKKYPQPWMNLIRSHPPLE